MSTTSSRKKDHIDLCVNEQVSFRSKSNGLEEWEFVHNALPELHSEEIDTSVSFLGKTLSYPLMISGMTGGYGEAVRINRSLSRTLADWSGTAPGRFSPARSIAKDRRHRRPIGFRSRHCQLGQTPYQPG